MALRDHVYPALVPAAGSAHGLLLELTEPEWHTVDAFENDLYELHRLSLDGSHSGWSYVCHDESEALPRNWDAETFADRELGDYVERCREWRSWYESR